MRIRESDSEVLEPGVDERLLAGRRAADPEAVRPEPVGPLDPAIRRPPDRRDVRSPGGRFPGQVQHPGSPPLFEGGGHRVSGSLPDEHEAAGEGGRHDVLQVGESGAAGRPGHGGDYPLPAHLLIALLLETSQQDAVVASYSGTAIAVSRSISHCRNVSSSAAWRSSQPSAVTAGRGS